MTVSHAIAAREWPASSSRSAVLVLLLMLALTLSYVDRQVLSLLVEPIKADLQITDTQFGLLQGMAFAVFYIGFGLPLGRLADIGSRRNLIASGITLWSFMTAICGTATSFLGLFVARAGVGIGEAALSPGAYSMIADSVPRRRLSLAMGIYSMGVYLGAGAALFVGGVVLKALAEADLASVPIIGDWAPWRLVFLCVGVPGLLMAAALMLLREPPRTQFDGRAAADIPTVAEVVRFVISERRLFGSLILGFACHNTTLYALLSWTPAFLGRQFDLAPSEVGLALGMLTSVGGCAGLIAGGVISDRLLAARRSDTPLLVGIISMSGIGVTTTWMLLFASSAQRASVMFALVMFFVALPIGSVAAALQLVAPNRFRAQVSALYLVLISLAGLLLGPLLPPLISDGVLQDPERIGLGLLITVAGMSVVSVACFLSGRGAYARRYAAIHATHSMRDDTP